MVASHAILVMLPVLAVVGTGMGFAIDGLFDEPLEAGPPASAAAAAAATPVEPAMTPPTEPKSGPEPSSEDDQAAPPAATAAPEPTAETDKESVGQAIERFDDFILRIDANTGVGTHERFEILVESKTFDDIDVTVWIGHAEEVAIGLASCVWAVLYDAAGNEVAREYSDAPVTFGEELLTFSFEDLDRPVSDGDVGIWTVEFHAQDLGLDYRVHADVRYGGGVT